MTPTYCSLCNGLLLQLPLPARIGDASDFYCPKCSPGYPDNKTDCLRRLSAVRAQVESSAVVGVAIITAGGTTLWQHSRYPGGAAFALVTGLEACKLDVIRHSVECDCMEHGAETGSPVASERLVTHEDATTIAGEVRDIYNRASAEAAELGRQLDAASAARHRDSTADRRELRWDLGGLA